MTEPVRILVVEDEENVAFGLQFALEAEGWSPRVVDRLALARQAMADAAAHDLVLLDLMLPDGDGVEFCRELREAGVLLPVIMLTARDSAEAIVDGLAAGADDYLTKPFGTAVLLGRIRAQLRRRAWARSPELARPAGELRSIALGGVELDLHTHQFARGDDRGELTALEMRLLLYFLRNPDRVVSRGELLEQVWGVSSNVATRTVDNFVMRLRKLFGSDDDQALFRTVRGTGYRYLGPVFPLPPAR
jgi:two-component system alkaline phosphatase synthesis response regulator PhoP